MSNDERKSRIDEDDIVNGAMAYYKRVDFDARTPFRIVFNGQPAADSGGVWRHIFGAVLKKLLGNYFKGDYKKVPVDNSDVLISGIMKLIGKVVVHSVVQGGPGIPIFSEAVYWYLVTGNVNETIE
eukprot:gene8374-9273_t